MSNFHRKKITKLTFRSHEGLALEKSSSWSLSSGWNLTLYQLARYQFSSVFLLFFIMSFPLLSELKQPNWNTFQNGPLKTVLELKFLLALRYPTLPVSVLINLKHGREEGRIDDRSSSLTPKCVKFAEEENIPHSGKKTHFICLAFFFLGNTGLHLLCVLECGVSGVAKKKMDAVAIRNTWRNGKAEKSLCFKTYCEPGFF